MSVRVDNPVTGRNAGNPKLSLIFFLGRGQYVSQREGCGFAGRRWMSLKEEETSLDRFTRIQLS